MFLSHALVTLAPLRHKSGGGGTTSNYFTSSFPTGSSSKSPILSSLSRTPSLLSSFSSSNSANERPTLRIFDGSPHPTPPTPPEFQTLSKCFKQVVNDYRLAYPSNLHWNYRCCLLAFLCYRVTRRAIMEPLLDDFNPIALLCSFLSHLLPEVRLTSQLLMDLGSVTWILENVEVAFRSR